MIQPMKSKQWKRLGRNNRPLSIVYISPREVLLNEEGCTCINSSRGTTAENVKEEHLPSWYSPIIFLNPFWCAPGAEPRVACLVP